MSLSRVLRLGVRHFSALVRSIGAVIAFRVALLLYPYKRIATHISVKASPPNEASQTPYIYAWAVRNAARIVPFASCLTQALALQYLLAQRGYLSSIRVGVRVDEKSQIDAHAWVMFEDNALIGGVTHDLSLYKVLTDLVPSRDA